MLERTMRVTARLWYSQMLQSAPTTANPRNGPRVRVGAGPADRVLMIGNGPLHGWGVKLRELSAPGHLAQLLHDRTRRAAVVEYVGEERMNAASASAWLGAAAGRGHDVAVIALGLNDALRLTDAERWRADMAGLLGQVLEAQHPAARVVLVGLPRVRAFAMADSIMGSLAQRHADRLDAVLQDLAAERSRVVWAPGPEERFEPERPLGSSVMYRSWAEQVVGVVLEQLGEVRAAKPPTDEPAESWDWQGTPALLEADGTEAQHRLDAITERVRERFGVASAGVNVLDGDRMHSVAGGGGGPRTMPRELAYCDATVRDDAPTLVPDAALDPRFRDNPFLEVVGLPFYAGVPLHAEDGRAVATLCVLDTAPRDDLAAEQLQGFAAEAERELRALERAAAGRTAPVA